MASARVLKVRAKDLEAGRALTLKCRQLRQIQLFGLEFSADWQTEWLCQLIDHNQQTLESIDPVVTTELVLAKLGQCPRYHRLCRTYVPHLSSFPSGSVAQLVDSRLTSVQHMYLDDVELLTEIGNKCRLQNIHVNCLPLHAVSLIELHTQHLTDLTIECAAFYGSVWAALGGVLERCSQLERLTLQTRKAPSLVLSHAPAVCNELKLPRLKILRMVSTAFSGPVLKEDSDDENTVLHETTSGHVTMLHAPQLVEAILDDSVKISFAKSSPDMHQLSVSNGNTSSRQEFRQTLCSCYWRKLRTLCCEWPLDEDEIRAVACHELLEHVTMTTDIGLAWTLNTLSQGLGHLDHLNLETTHTGLVQECGQKHFIKSHESTAHVARIDIYGLYFDSWSSILVPFPHVGTIRLCNRAKLCTMVFDLDGKRIFPAVRSVTLWNIDMSRDDWARLLKAMPNLQHVASRSQSWKIVRALLDMKTTSRLKTLTIPVMYDQQLSNELAHRFPELEVLAF